MYLLIHLYLNLWVLGNSSEVCLLLQVSAVSTTNDLCLFPSMKTLQWVGNLVTMIKSNSERSVKSQNIGEGRGMERQRIEGEIVTSHREAFNLT